MHYLFQRQFCINCSFNNLKFNKRQFSKQPDKSTVNIPSTEIVTPLPPLTEPIPGLPTPIYSTAKFQDNETQVTILSNGLKVASEKRFGQFCTVGGNLILLINIKY